MADHGDAALGPLCQPVAEPGDAAEKHLFGLEHDGLRMRAVAVPPRIVEMIEGQRREGAAQIARLAADIARMLEPLAVQGLDVDRRVVEAEGVQRRLDGAREWRGDDEIDPQDLNLCA